MENERHYLNLLKPLVGASITDFQQMKYNDWLYKYVTKSMQLIYNVDTGYMNDQSHWPNMQMARQMTIYIIYKITNSSLSEIVQIIKDKSGREFTRQRFNQIIRKIDKDIEVKRMIKEKLVAYAVIKTLIPTHNYVSVK